MAMGLSLGSASVCLEGVGCLSLEIGEGPPRCDYMLSYDTDTSLLSHDYLVLQIPATRVVGALSVAVAISIRHRSPIKLLDAQAKSVLVP